MKKYTVKQLAKLAGVSIRTLHHYDQIGLLKPESRSEKNYRYYGPDELLRLQQILFYKELGFPLQQIKEILEDPAFNLIEALESHKMALKKRSERIQQLLITIEKTINKLKNHTDMKDEEMYEGLNAKAREEMRSEVSSKWGKDQLEKAEERVRKMGKQGLAAAKAEAKAINQRLATLMDQDPANQEVQVVIAQHYQHLQQFRTIDKEGYRGLSQLYTADERFKAHYDEVQPGLASFLQKGMEIFCNNDLQVL